MNCTPGDLAIVVRPPVQTCCGHTVDIVRYGTIVRVTTLHPCEIWGIEEPIDVTLVFGCGNVVTGTLTAIGDEYLRPLRGDELEQIDELAEVV